MGKNLATLAEEAETGSVAIKPPLSPIKARLLAMNKGLADFEKAMLVFFTAIFVFSVFFQWALRVCFGTGFLWMPEVIQYSMLWMGFFGASMATFTNEHFRIDIVRAVKSRSALNAIRAITYFIGALFCLLYLVSILDFLGTVRGYKEGLHYYANIPKWPFYTILVYFFSITFLRFTLSGAMKLSLNFSSGRKG